MRVKPKTYEEIMGLNNNSDVGQEYIDLIETLSSHKYLTIAKVVERSDRNLPERIYFKEYYDLDSESLIEEFNLTSHDIYLFANEVVPMFISLDEDLFEM